LFNSWTVPSSWIEISEFGPEDDGAFRGRNSSLGWFKSGSGRQSKPNNGAEKHDLWDPNGSATVAVRLPCPRLRRGGRRLSCCKHANTGCQATRFAFGLQPAIGRCVRPSLRRSAESLRNPLQEKSNVQSSLVLFCIVLSRARSDCFGFSLQPRFSTTCSLRSSRNL
jgi:hypothetical protein